MKKKLFIILFFFLFPLSSQAAVIKETYPRLANYFLKWEISDQEAIDLSQWDLLILDMENQENNPEKIKKIRQLNPDIIILAYIGSQEIYDRPSNYGNAYLREILYEGLYEGWWLKDYQGNKISNWPGTSMLNISDGAQANGRGQRFNDYLPEFVSEHIKKSGLWDGIFYDNIWSTVSWLNSGNVNLRNSFLTLTPSQMDADWINGVKKIISKTRILTGSDFIIIGNGPVFREYQSDLNGMMLENFPAFWNNSPWASSIRPYLDLPKINSQPSLPIINVYNQQTNYQKFRFGLASALLGDGFYSYDYDVTNHGQTWWYDEYKVDLGSAQSAPYNILNNSSTLQPGLWRRDFKNGVVLINTTNQKQTKVFPQENLEKIKGNQAADINNGQKINYVQINPQDGLVLLKRNYYIKNYPFTNGYFYRIFSQRGQQVTNGLFSYISSFPGEAEVIMASDSAGAEADISLIAANGRISLYKNGRAVSSFAAFDQNYKKPLSLAAPVTSDGYFKEVAAGAGQGGGPQVRLFTPTGRLTGSFFAYDQKFRGGVNIALADVDGDGYTDLVAAPGPGGEPQLKVFSLSGRLKKSFLAYDQKFRGGVNIAAADLNNDGISEIITGPGKGGGPQVKIFSGSGKLLGSFFAYEANSRSGIKVGASDMNNDGQLEIIVGLKKF